MNEDLNILKLRVFGATNCENCKLLLSSLAHHGLAYDFIDANDPKHEKLCDFFDVDQLPLIQILQAKNNAVVAFHAGLIDPMKFLQKTAQMMRQERQKKVAFNLAETKKKNNRCGGCYD